MNALECRRIQKSFGSVNALCDASLSVRPGEIRAILGGNGSGKSTLAKILGGVVRPNQGEIKLFDKTCSIRSPRHSKRLGIVITSQELSLFTNHTVETNLLMCDIPRSIGVFTNRARVKHVGRQVMDELNLSHLIGKTVAELAANEQYMVEFAKALIQKPKILIVDEITSALYREEVELVKQMLFRLKENGTAVLFISHRMAEIYSICDSVTIMRNGETVATVGIQEKNENELLSMMSGRDVTDVIHSHTGSVATADGPPLLMAPQLRLSRFGTQFDFRVQPGEFVGIAGLQGHGQSDLVRTLFGMRGSVHLKLEGQDLHVSSPRKAVAARMAFISGDREKEGVFSVRSLSENLAAVKELVMGQTGLAADAVLREQGVKFASAKQPIRTLSGGNQQKVVIGRWLVTNPKILLADDPTKGIDVQARLDVHHMLCRLIEKGSSVVFVSSDDEELVQLAHMAPSARILVMYEGKIVRVLTGLDITTENIISASVPRGARFK
ncbi:sugar ABC transporter ATP-binding protein [Alicyclobacillus shizuokensis]|uniref:sugar ABC transporter ATP-binding protein n=1 Tax=Alicyclobacillus shizuokensis TaxID=392014 RepID=UPI0009F98FC8|nr:sugar ABC transporter ATP-binding protein [Alicyclobacillus shizuokensis]